MSLLTPAVLAVYHIVAALAAVLVPLLGGAGPAVAVVVFTAGVRLCLHPLNRAQTRAQAAAGKAREALAPTVEKLNRTYKNDPRRAQRETFELYRASRIPLLPGVSHTLVQAPVFLVVYRIFESQTVAGHRNSLLGDRLFGVGLGSHFADLFRAPALAPGHVAVFALLLVAIAAIATWSSVRMRRTVQAGGQAAGATRITALLPFATVVTAAIVPLAAGLYLATTNLLSVLERGFLQKSANRATSETVAAV